MGLIITGYELGQYGKYIDLRFDFPQIPEVNWR